MLDADDDEGEDQSDYVHESDFESEYESEEVANEAYSDHDEDAGVDDAQTAQPDLLLQIVVISEAVEVEVVPEAVVVVPTGDAIIKPLLICGKMTTQAFLMRISCQIKHLDQTTFLM